MTDCVDCGLRSLNNDQCTASAVIIVYVFNMHTPYMFLIYILRSLNNDQCTTSAAIIVYVFNMRTHIILSKIFENTGKLEIGLHFLLIYEHGKYIGNF